MDQAHTVEVTLDQQVEDISIRPTPGHLFKLGGVATAPTMRDATITLTLVSDMGKEITQADSLTGKFQFNPQRRASTSSIFRRSPARTTITDIRNSRWTAI